MPTDYTFADASGYTLVCNGGCTANSSLTKAKSGNVLTFTNALSTNVAAGTLIDISVTGFQNPSTETVYSVYYELIWDTDPHLIDKFENLGTLTGSQSIYSRSFSNTYILITDLAKRKVADCRIRPP